MLELRLIARSYQAASGRASVLKDVTLAIPPGGCAHISGANGSGKTTLLQIIAGHITPDAGLLDIDGFRLTSLSADQLSDWRYANSAMVYATQTDLIPFLSGTANIHIGGHEGEFVDRRFRNLIELISEDVNPDFLLKKAVLMSDGQRRIVQYLRALLLQPRVLCVDDPSAHMRASLVEKLLHFAAHETKCPYIIVASTRADDSIQIVTKKYTLSEGLLLNNDS